MKRLLFIILSAAMLLRLVVFFTVYKNPEIIKSHDASQYLALAKNMVDHRVFSRSAKEPLQPEAKRTPGYPAYIAFFYLVYSHDLLSPLIFSHVLLGVCTVWLTFSLGKLLFEKKIGLIAAAIFSLSPISIIMTGRGYSDTLFVLCFTICVLLLVHGLKFNSFRSILACAILLSITVLIRPIGIIIVPVFFIICLFIKSFSSALRISIILVTVSMLLPLLWMQRNEHEFGRFSLSSVSGGNLLNYNVAGTEAHRKGISFSESREQLRSRLFSYDYAPEDSWPVSKQEALAREVIKEHPVSFLFYNGIDSLKCLRPGFSFLLKLFDAGAKEQSLTRIFQKGNVRDILPAMLKQNVGMILLEVFMAVFTAVLFAFGFLGIFILLRKRDWLNSALLFIVPLAMIYVTGSAGSARLRLPVEPLLSILAAVGICAIIPKINRYIKINRKDSSSN